MRVNRPQIFVAQNVGQNVQLLFGLGIFKDDWLDEIEIQLLLVHHVKDNHLVATKAQMLEAFNHTFGDVIKIRYQHYDSPASE